MEMAEGSSTPTGDMELEMKRLAFAKSNNTVRTPPSNSQEETEVYTVGEESSPEEILTLDGKRKRKEGEVNKELQSEIDFLRQAMINTVKTIMELNELVKDSTNVKKEIRTKTNILNVYASQLVSSKVTELLDNVEDGASWKLAKTGTMDKEKENKRTAVMVTQGTQTESAAEAKSYQCSILSEGNPLITGDKDADLVVWRYSKDENMEGGIQRLFKERYGGLEQSGDSVGHIKTTTWVMTTGNDEAVDKHVFRINIEKDTEDMRKNLEMVKEKMNKEGRKKLAMAWDNPTKINELRDIIEKVMADSGIKIHIHMPKLGGTAKGKEQRDKNTEVIFIKKGENMTYADRLREIKTQVIGSGLENTIQGVRETRNKEIMITLKSSKNDTKERVKKVLEDKMGKANIRVKEKPKAKRMFNIRDIDAVTSKEEVSEAVKNELGLGEYQMEVVSVRPSFAETQTALVLVNNEGADILNISRFIKIGLPNCRIKERIKVESCFRCWEIGHDAKNCNGPDRSKSCKNCGEEGHERKNCKKESKCVTCGEGHPVNTTRCLVFRKEIRRIEQGNKFDSDPTGKADKRGTPKSSSKTRQPPKQPDKSAKRQEKAIRRDNKPSTSGASVGTNIQNKTRHHSQ